MKEEELKYTLRLLENLNQEIFEDVLQFFYAVEDSKPVRELSHETLLFFEQNLKTNPVTTTSVLRYIQSHLSDNKDALDKIQSIYLTALTKELAESSLPDKLITLISLVRWEEDFVPNFIQKILRPVSEESYRQYRKQILISLVPHDKPELLRVTSEYIQKNEPQKEFKLTPEYMLELCYQDKTHWLLKAAEVYKHQLHDLKNVTFKINNFTKQILIMVLIDLTNSPETYDLPSLVHQLSNIFSILDTYTTADEQLQFYITEVKRELTLIKFCLENNCKIMTTSIFSQLLSQSALAVISQVCRLFKVDRYKVSRLLNANNDYITELANVSKRKELQENSVVNWDITTYNSYCAITTVIDTIVDTSEGSEPAQETTSSLDEIKRLILSIQPIQCCVEIIENIFSCLFLRYEYFSCQEHNQEYPCGGGAHSECSYFYSKKKTNSSKSIKSMGSGFMCNSLVAQSLLNTLKICLEKLETNIHAEKTDPNIFTRFKRLVKIVNHSVWKLQLVSSLSPDPSPLQLKLCLDYVEVDASSEDEDRDMELKVTRKKPKARRRYTNPKPDYDQVMLASTISVTDDVYVSTKGNNIDFISIMLAKPNCLVALALYHNDFSKANQILEMFDLADSEIATEVTFTEQLRSLVAKIKNILYYRGDTRYSSKELSALSVVSTEVMGLVDGFLAANRAPNSFDIIELEGRHPHLQLYSHQNAPFINAVDILLSSGLNREITYGLINVVERKLSEVRNCTDISGVKKTNYIRFVEDIVSVVFEILGNADKSFDFADNICGLITDCRIPIKHKEFCKLNQLSKEMRQSCEDLADIVNSRQTNEFDPNVLLKYHQIYMNIVAASDKDICNIGEVCRNGNKKMRIHYLRMCYIYCKTVSQLEHEDRPTESSNDLPYFSVLEKPLHDIFGNMINNKELPVTFLEPICKKLNVSLIPKLILNFCPSITLAGPHTEATEENFNNMLQAVYDYVNPEENLFIEPDTNLAPLPRAPDTQCLTYIVLHNWVLAHIIKKIHISPNENSLQQSMDARTKCLNNYMELDRFNCTKVLFGGNKYLASLHSTIDLDKLFQFMRQLVELGKILKCLNIIESLTERQLICSANLMNLRDLILFKLSTDPKIPGNWKYCQYLNCSELKVDLILNHLSSWPAEAVIEVLDYLRFLLDIDVLDDNLYQRCSDWMTKIPLYDQIASIIGVNHWYTVYEKSVNNPENIVDVLLDNQQFKLCLEWADVHEVSEHMKNLIIMNLLRQLFEYTNQATPEFVRELLSRLPNIQAMDLIQEEMSKVRNVEILQVCVDFISESSCEWKSFENIKIGLQIMIEIDMNLRNTFWEIIEKPLLMIELFLMNAKLEVLTNIINKIAPSLKKDPSGDNLYYNIKSIESVVISRNAVDALLRFYAEKALDMRNPRNRCATPPKPSNDSLMLSIDSINIESASKPFVMPEQVPSKEQWVEDYSADRCMLCHTSTFSMIMRRHHCRRCGRLVCHVCSRHRMQVPTYPSGVKFRVCDDCFTQTMNKKSSSDQDNLMHSSTSDSAASGVTCMDWCLSTSASKNAAVRTEFSFEFTPNVTLCLSIMKMHSINLDYPRFLLDRSDEIARELSSGGDARLLVRARRSLLLAAAELYSRTPQEIGAMRVAETGAAHAVRCLAHADAMATLVKHQAQHLVPRQGAHPSQIVRSLLEAEKWELALEIATKSGLSRNSVLAAWGKACLKAGCFKLAREKFSHCFKNTINVCTEVEECEYGREAKEISDAQIVNRRLTSLRNSERTISMSSMSSDGRPRSNPPLLNEIVAMLEEINYPVNQQLLNKADSMKSSNERLITMNTSKKKIPLAEPALNIMHTLARVKKIKLGDYSDFQTATVQPKKSLAQNLLKRNNNQEPKTDYSTKRLDPFFYKECVYYLSNYGSHFANIAFYMKHSNLTEVIKYCYDNMVDKETFTEAVYMECLKKDKVDSLLKAMTDMDSTLDMWADYIMHICRTLEMSKRLDALYALQCGSNQHARASATCALLYSRPLPASPRPLAALQARQHHLAAALQHLGQCTPSTHTHKANEPKSLNFLIDKTTLDNLMTTMSRQIEVAKYLAACEAAGRVTEKVLIDVIPVQGRREETDNFRPLTLFGSNTDKIRLVAVILACGQTIEIGFELAFKIITEHKLDSMNIYRHVAKYLVQVDRFMEVKTLAKCIRNSKETAANLMSEQVLEAGVCAVVARCEARGQLHDEMAELLIADINSVAIKISCYLVCRNVQSAYILAARHDRTNDLRRVLQEAERLNNEHVRSAALKRLASRTHHHTTVTQPTTTQTK